MLFEEALREIQNATAGQVRTKLGFSGGQSKSAFKPRNATSFISIREHQGIVAYDPSEYLITALAGTTIAELNAALEEHNQYLPFDPLFARQQATLGGTIAGGVSGPSSMLHGRLRDALMAIEIIDGLGKRVRGGGRVVKNAAGFDIPKLMIGSRGSFGLITEATLKVYPRPQAFCTLAVQGTLHDLIDLACRIQRHALPIAGLNIATTKEQLEGCELFPESQPVLLLRIAGVAPAVESIKAQLLNDLLNSAQVITRDEAQIWDSMRSWIEGGECLGRLHCDPRKAVEFLTWAEEAGLTEELLGTHGGLVFWTQKPLPADSSLRKRLLDLNAGYLQIKGEYVRLPNLHANYEDRIQKAFDPKGIFASPMGLDSSAIKN